ncbi:MAG: sugar transferase [Armatimonadota bacterium]
MRRLVDLILGGVLLALTAPLLALVAAVSWIVSRRVFFRQTRIGLRLRPFTILKFQTMVDGAAAGGTVTARGDSRITPLGRILRATKVDEMPQLINVVRGEMSLVGPRPLPPNEVAAIPPDLAHRVYAARPGMTGVAQLAFAHEERLLGTSEDPQAMYFNTVLPEKVALELAYARRRTWATDLAILVLTPIAGFSPRLGRAAVMRLVPGGPTTPSSSASAV